MITPAEWEHVKQQLAKLENENKQLIADRDWLKQAVLELLEEEEDPFPDITPEEYQRILSDQSTPLHDILAEAERELLGTGK